MVFLLTDTLIIQVRRGQGSGAPALLRALERHAEMQPITAPSRRGSQPATCTACWVPVDCNRCSCMLFRPAGVVPGGYQQHPQQRRGAQPVAARGPGADRGRHAPADGRSRRAAHEAGAPALTADARNAPAARLQVASNGGLVARARQAGPEAPAAPRLQAIASFFVARVRACLHLVLCFSPVGDAFRQRIRMFPSLVGRGSAARCAAAVPPAAVGRLARLRAAPAACCAALT